MKLDFSDVEQELKRVLTRDVRKALSGIAREGKQKLEHTVSGWLRKPKFSYRTRLLAGSYTVSFFVHETELPVWQWACYGTTPHDILPRGPWPLRVRFYPPKSSPIFPWTADVSERGGEWYYQERFAWRVRDNAVTPRRWDKEMGWWLMQRASETLPAEVVRVLSVYGRVRFVSKFPGKEEGVVETHESEVRL